MAVSALRTSSTSSMNSNCTSSSSRFTRSSSFSCDSCTTFEDTMLSPPSPFSFASFDQRVPTSAPESPPLVLAASPAPAQNSNMRRTSAPHRDSVAGSVAALARMNIGRRHSSTADLSVGPTRGGQGQDHMSVQHLMDYASSLQPDVLARLTDRTPDALPMGFKSGWGWSITVDDRRSRWSSRGRVRARSHSQGGGAGRARRNARCCCTSELCSGVHYRRDRSCSPGRTS
ncbi:hypothetical protein V1512DRAFT_261073 [Lipomyces arxii]|uniref:uncharacterized protein n=1 Tax=Lipomyces arxii TaxID=56418 RepID=UPI0034CF5E0B